MKNDYQKNGFTLIEVLIASTIFAMVMVIVASTLSWASTYNLKLNEMRIVGQDARKIMNMISDDIRQANGSASIKIDFTDENIGELAIINCSNPAFCSLRKNYQSNILPDIDLNLNYNNALLITDLRDEKAILYYEYDNNIVRNELSLSDIASDFYNIIPSLSAIEDYYINSQGADVTLGFAGHTSLIHNRENQPFINIKLLAETEEYDNLTSSYRSKIELQTMITSREYNIYE